MKKYLDTPSEVDMKECQDDVVRACEINDVSLLYKCIALGGPACYLSCGTFPLHVAARRDASACCMLLLVNGYDVLGRDANDLTASAVARMAGHEDLSVFLLEREDRVLARSRTNSDASEEDNMPSDLNNEFDNVEMQQHMKDMVSKALSSSSDEDTDLALGSSSDSGFCKSSRETTAEDITE
jgi:hypothetical protein